MDSQLIHDSHMNLNTPSFPFSWQVSIPIDGFWETSSVETVVWLSSQEVKLERLLSGPSEDFGYDNRGGGLKD